MLDLKYIREHPGEVKEGLKKLNTAAPIDEILSLDERRRSLLSETEELKHKRNVVSKDIGRAKEKDQKLIKEMRDLGERVKTLDEEVKGIDQELDGLLLQVPNMPHSSVPVGKDESQNVVVRQEGEPKKFDFEPLPHWDLGANLGILDFDRGVKISGTRFYVLRGPGSRLQRALIAWMLDLHTQEHDYEEIYPPYLVKRDCLFGSGQLPKFDENLYRDVEDDLWLIPTAEVPLANLHRDEILEPHTLPLHYVGYSACFRREKMSAGRDTRGLKRGHQFDKVELFKFTAPETSYDELEALVNDAEDICRRLEIPHRVVMMCSGDLGFTASKKYDIEMWAPGVKEWLEVSSCSNCEDFQARRANIRFRREPGGRPEYVHTLNGSGLALPRTLIAIMENYQEPDGSIVTPKVLRPYLGGLERISGQTAQVDR